MIEIALHRGLSKVVASPKEAMEEQGKTDRGWQDEVTMIEIAFRRRFSEVVAGLRVATEEQGKTDRGWQDKRH